MKTNDREGSAHWNSDLDLRLYVRQRRFRGHLHRVGSDVSHAIPLRSPPTLAEFEVLPFQCLLPLSFVAAAELWWSEVVRLAGRIFGRQSGLACAARCRVTAAMW